MKRVAVLCVGILVLALVPAAVFAQGLLPGLPSFGGVFGSRAACGEAPSLGLGPLVGYVGWNPGGHNTGFGAGGGPLAGITQIDQSYETRGLWLGVQQSAKLSDWLGIIASGWYFFPSNNTSNEVYNNGILGTRTWDTSTQWWFVDAVAALGALGGGGCGSSGLSLLVGLRYDYFNTQFTSSNPFFTGPGILGDQATVRSEGWIPLLGTQAAYVSSASNLVVRVVGFPYLAGNARYRETIAGASAEFNGTYNNGYFLEVFTEYSRTFGPGGMGVFARWNGTHGNSDSDIELNNGVGNSGFKLGLNRNSWTIGGSFTLNFNAPI